jgi:replication factor C subunit 2/4
MNINNQRYNNTPWIEKYRPSKLNDIILNKNTLLRITNILNTKELPNIIIPGVPGIGKTTTIKCIANELYGKYVNEAVLELNASDDRGIKAVQDTLIPFCQKQMDLNNKNKNDKRIYANHKLIFLDEADNMTDKAQKLISKLIEQYDKTTKFAFTCNDSSILIENIQSKCIILHFNRIEKEQIIEKLNNICKIENINLNKKILSIIADISDGDLRSAINNLQLIYRSFNNINDITSKDVYLICSKPQPIILSKFISNCINKDFINSKNIILNLKKGGYNAFDIILGIIQILKTSDIQEDIKMKYFEISSKFLYTMSNGIASDIQLCSYIISLIE